ncbi:hypothetical protein [Nocardioides sp.]|uniref:hypothetical protein n=1 Tax=Nocardioides sp. TaxID=35761 RepID=UPI003513A154
MLTTDDFHQLPAAEQASHRRRAFLIGNDYGLTAIRSGSQVLLAGLSEVIHETATPVAWINPADAIEVGQFIRFMHPDVEPADLPNLVETTAARLAEWIEERDAITVRQATP